MMLKVYKKLEPVLGIQRHRRLTVGGVEDDDINGLTEQSY